MYPVARGLPNNRKLKVLGRAYAAPGEVQPVLWRGGWWVSPALAALVAVCAVEVLATLL